MRRVLVAAVLATTAVTAYVLACGPFVTQFSPVETVVPPHRESYGRGNVGVVRPHFARRYLVQAYRRFSGSPPLPNAVPAPPSAAERSTPPVEQWQQLAGVPGYIATERSIGNYEYIHNCLDDAFLAAIRTLKARSAQYGVSSPQTGDWIRAQNAVFSNCHDGLVLPDAAPASADALTRADRAYQAAAAHFYALKYDEALTRFRAIAADSSSPWRVYGRYMAARTLIRQATVPEKGTSEPLLAAEGELRRVLEDPAATSLHASARGLLEFVALRMHPIDRLRDLSASLANAPSVTDQQLTDYQRLMDTLVGDTTEFDYDKVRERNAIAQSADLNDWILSMQGTGSAAADRAVAQWKRSGALPWLAAALWKVPAEHAESPALLEAAGRVDRSAPAFATVAFLRVRLLAARGQRDQARALLATLPVTPGGSVEPETINLLNAERFMLADSMDELLRSAPRAILPARVDAWVGNDLKGAPLTGPVFDDDAGVVFNLNMPLTRLVEAATSPILPPRLRLRIASAAFARAWMLKKDDQALAVAPILRTLSPSLRADMARFESAATADERRIAGLRLLLRTPGLRGGVIGVEDDEDYAQKELSRYFDHMFRRSWWCSFATGGRNERRKADSELIEVLYAGQSVGYPAFLSAAERTAAERELAALSTIGTAPNYLAAEAVKWANSSPSDLDAAEALAHAVEGTRWACTDDKTTAASRSAFQTLHRLFPKSEWALKTKYWY